MSQQIRPLVAFKKENIQYYNRLVQISNYQGTEKSIENNFYYFYAVTKLREPDVNDSFFFKNKELIINRGIITELGRLLIYGWYYQIADYAKGLCSLIIENYLQGAKGKINREKAVGLVRHIRENILYYNNNEEVIDLINKTDLC